jgi:methylated-DNA-[protein]-cysteine S-methyltransferase
MIGIYTKSVNGVWFGVASAEKIVFSTIFAHSQQEALKCLLSSIPLNVPFQVYPEPSAFAETILASITKIYDGKGISRMLSLATDHLSDYTQKVLETTSLIPVGYVTSYGKIAQATGGSPRAVGGVMANNPFVLIVPCHRVVKSDFTLGGYGRGLNAKLELLIREKRRHIATREIALGDRALQIFPIENILRKLEKDYKMKGLLS